MRVNNSYSSTILNFNKNKQNKSELVKNQETNPASNTLSSMQPSFCGFFGLFKKKTPLDYIPLSQDQFRNIITDFEKSRELNPLNSVVTSNDFIEWINDFAGYLETDLKKAVKTLIKYSADEENKIGSGLYNNVYEIPKTDKFVIRAYVHGLEKPDVKSFELGEINKIEDEYPDLNLGQAIIKIGDKIKLLKKQTGRPGGVPRQFRSSPDGANFYSGHLKTVSEMPQTAYDDFANTLKILFNHNKSFDAANPQNVLIDEKKGKFFIVDDLDDPEKFAAYVGRTPLEHMLSSLMDFSDADIFYWDKFFICRQNNYSINKPEINKYCSEILNKCIKAVKNADIPMPKASPRIEDALDLAGKSTSEWGTFLQS